MQWRSRRFFCDQPDCPQRIFTERLPEVAAACSRTTTRLNAALRHIAFNCGGEAGSRLAGTLGMPTSPDRLLRVMRQMPTDEAPTPTVLGVDDWAFRRGHRYGTILCDLEQHRPIDLLPERSSQSFSSWLETHPGVKVISRDRGDDYTKGATEGAPQAVQVADRFHLLRNLHDALVRAANRHHADVAKAAKATASRVRSEAVEQPEPAAEPSSLPVKLTQAEQVKQSNRAGRRQRYERVIELRRQGLSLRAIARELGMHRGTIRRFVCAGRFPERATRQYHRRTDPLEDELRRRWEAGCHNAAQLTRELKGSGADVSYHMIRRRVAGWRQMNDAGRTTGSKPVPPPRTVKRPSSTRVAWFLMKHEAELKPQEQMFREELLQCCPELRDAATLAQEFAGLVRQRRADDLDSWIALASTKTAPPDLRRFARGLTTDYAAVRSALTLPWSNGQVEGQINRLKLVKRQMYGRANFDLLRSRFLYAG
jgi:transposase